MSVYKAMDKSDNLLDNPYILTCDKTSWGRNLAITIIAFDDGNQVTTTLKYHGKNRFYLSSDLVKALGEPDEEINKGDEMVIKILAINKLKNDGVKQQWDI